MVEVVVAHEASVLWVPLGGTMGGGVSASRSTVCSDDDNEQGRAAVDDEGKAASAGGGERSASGEDVRSTVRLGGRGGEYSAHGVWPSPSSASGTVERCWVPGAGGGWRGNRRRGDRAAAAIHSSPTALRGARSSSDITPAMNSASDNDSASGEALETDAAPASASRRGK